MDRRQCALFPAPNLPHPPPLPPSLPSMAGGTASNNVEARLDCSDWGHWLWWFDLLISPPPSLKCGVWDAEANLRQLWTILCLAREWEATRNLRKETTLILITRCSLQNPPPSSSVLVRRRTCVCPPRSFVRDLACNRARVCVCVFFFASVCVCGGGCEAVQSPGRTEWIYKLMEFKASSIDYHYNKQQHTECLIIFRQRFCALSSNSADAVTLSDICLWLQLDGIQKEK